MSGGRAWTWRTTSSRGSPWAATRLAWWFPASTPPLTSAGARPGPSIRTSSSSRMLISITSLNHPRSNVLSVHRFNFRTIFLLGNNWLHFPSVLCLGFCSTKMF